MKSSIFDRSKNTSQHQLNRDGHVSSKQAYFCSAITSNRSSIRTKVTFLNCYIFAPLIIYGWLLLFDPRENKSWPWDNLSLKWMRGKCILKNKYTHAKSVSNLYSYSQGIQFMAFTNSRISVQNFVLTHYLWVIK